MPKILYEPGQSGNPKGRPKGAKGLAQQFLAELSKAANPDAPESVSKLTQLIQTQIDKAVKGDNRAMEKVLERMEGIDAKLERNNAPRFDFTDADRETIAEIHRRLTE